MYDIVCGMKLGKRCSFHSTYNKKKYEFCGKNCKNEFDKTPKKFINGTPVIELRDVHKDYQLGTVTVPVLHGLSLRIWKNDFVALKGVSGSGKTTAMNIIGALDTVTKGEVLLDGKDVSKMSENQLAKIRGSKIGFVFQQFNLLGALNCEENIQLPMFFRNGLETEKDQRTVQKYIKSVGLEHRKAHKPLEMSGGEQQRAAIARALVNDPEIIIADEPTGNLDSETGKTIMKVLKELNKQGRTIVVVTHDPNIAKETGKILYLKDGALVTSES
ncbi:MAG: ATP-binding cassette domain-containing protein [Nitrospirota bacterium]